MWAGATAYAADGQAVYEENCRSCHSGGVWGAPQLGDKEGWAERVATGLDSLVSNAIGGMQGYGGNMPPRGGNTNLSDAEIRAAVTYRVEAAK